MERELVATGVSKTFTTLFRDIQEEYETLEQEKTETPRTQYEKVTNDYYNVLGRMILLNEEFNDEMEWMNNSSRQEVTQIVLGGIWTTLPAIQQFRTAVVNAADPGVFAFCIPSWTKENLVETTLDTLPYPVLVDNLFRWVEYLEYYLSRIRSQQSKNDESSSSSSSSSNNNNSASNKVYIKWQKLDTNSLNPKSIPSPRAYHTLSPVNNPNNTQILSLLFGGSSSSSIVPSDSSESNSNNNTKKNNSVSQSLQSFSDYYSLNYSSSTYDWSPISSSTSSTSTTSGSIPAARSGHTLTPLSSTQFLLFGGSDPSSNTYFNDLHLFDIDSNSWTCLFESSPSSSSSSSSSSRSPSLFSSFWGSSHEEKEEESTNKDNKSQYTKVEAGPFPVKRSHHISAIYKKRNLIIFGGQSSKNKPLNDIWSFNLDDLKWTLISNSDSKQENTKLNETKTLINEFYMINRSPSVIQDENCIGTIVDDRFLLIFYNSILEGSKNKEKPKKEASESKSQKLQVILFDLEQNKWLKPKILRSKTGNQGTSKQRGEASVVLKEGEREKKIVMTGGGKDVQVFDLERLRWLQVEEEGVGVGVDDLEIEKGPGRRAGGTMCPVRNEQTERDQELDEQEEQEEIEEVEEEEEEQEAEKGKEPQQGKHNRRRRKQERNEVIVFGGRKEQEEYCNDLYKLSLRQ